MAVCREQEIAWVMANHEAIQDKVKDTRWDMGVQESRELAIFIEYVSLGDQGAVCFRFL